MRRSARLERAEGEAQEALAEPAAPPVLVHDDVLDEGARPADRRGGETVAHLDEEAELGVELAVAA